jgi:diguanylate cyclase (GGDEF)-like protein
MHAVSRASRSYLLLLVSVATIAGAIWAVSHVERHAYERSDRQSRAAQGLLTSMLDQETGLRGYLLTGRSNFLEPKRLGEREYSAALRDARAAIGADQTGRRLIDSQAEIAGRWYALAQSQIDRTGANGPRRISVASALQRKGVMDQFREANARFQELIAARHDEDLSRAGWILVLVVLGVAGFFGVLGYFVIWRGRHASRLRRERDSRYAESQSEFIETMQVTGSQDEAQLVLGRHLERSLPGSQVTVLNRNNSENRLEAATAIDDDSALAAALTDAEPQSCMAIRLGRAYVRDSSATPLMECQVCGRLPGSGTCQPLVVGGEGIGSVLVQSPAELDETDRRRVRDSVVQAAPVMANLRNLSLAQLRAATDALTGLPNKRSVRDTLNRMVAQTNRTLDPLSAIVLDLDHFKEINDVYGHAKGDETLAAVGAVLREVVRGSDFAGRSGGEEFLVLLPATGPEGAEQAAEKIRAAISAINIRGVDRAITISAGVASLPVHASDGEGLLRIADRALYVAKARGRNRVELAPMPGSGEGGAVVALPTSRPDMHEDD